MRTNTGQVLYIPRIGQRADFQHPLMRGCVGWWPLNDGAGTKAVDLSANGNDGTQSGGVGWDSTTRGTAADFDGVDDRFDLTNLGMDFSSDDFTVSMWIYVDSISSPEYLWVKQTSGNSFSCIFWFNTATTLQLIHFTSASACMAQYTIASSLVGGWNHLVATDVSPSSLLSSNKAVYLNGELLTPDSSANGTGIITESSGTLSLAGRISDNLRQLSGDYQNVRVYNRALSPTEILELYTNPWSGLSMPSETRYFFFSSPSPTINPFSRIITSSTILNKSGKTVIRRGA